MNKDVKRRENKDKELSEQERKANELEKTELDRNKFRAFKRELIGIERENSG